MGNAWEDRQCAYRSTDESIKYRDAILRSQLRCPVVLSEYRPIPADYALDDVTPHNDWALGISLITGKRREKVEPGPTPMEVYESKKAARLEATGAMLFGRHGKRKRVRNKK